MNRILNFLLLAFCLPLFGQTPLTKEEALAITLEQNFGILMSKNNVEISKNNSSILNAGYLPNVAVGGGGNFSASDSEIAFPGQFLEDGSPRPNRSLNDQESKRYNAGVDVNFILFDGLGRKYNYQKLKEQYALSELQLRETIEQTIVQLYTVYFSVAQLTETKAIFEQALEVSQIRLQRAESAFFHGQANKLAVLNAQVDVTNDSINLLQAAQQLDNTKRDLNLLMNQSMDFEFTVDTSVDFIAALQLEDWMASAPANNVALLKQRKNVEINAYDVKVSQSGYLPTLGLVGSYGWNLNQSPPSAFFPGTDNTTYSLGLGASLSWNIFDGGRTSVRVQNAKIALDNQNLMAEQVVLTFDRDLQNAEQSYHNTQQVYSIQQNQVETASYNFERSQAQYAIGAITAIEFRQAQVNLRNAQNQAAVAKYQAKLAEIELIRISGQLLNAAL